MANVVEADPSQLAPLIRSISSTSGAALSVVPGVASTVALDADRKALAALEVFVVQSDLGVAENGAVWLPLSRMVTRAALFLAEYAIVALEKDAIVPDLHAAYERLEVRAEPFGIFVAGPSKTADIEQSLVIGAHGPKRLTLVLLERLP